MRRKIPSTSMLEAFESAARHLSFTRAADELSFTESAISRKIALLEEYLGVQLFTRVKKRLQLTDAGKSYSQRVQESLDKLEMDTTLTMAHDAGRISLELAVLPTFALKWLMPRLHEFNALHPEVTIHVAAREEPFLFSEAPFDAAIHFDHPVWANATSTYLFTEELIPICSPQLIGGKHCRKPADLLDYVLMHKTGRPEAWSRWFELAGCPDARALKGPRYNMYAMSIEAARRGAGIALVPRTYVMDDIESGQLTVPWEMVVPGAKDYYFVVPEQKQASQGVQLFLAWLLKVAEQYRDVTEQA
ncbi:LysR family transcriptional regulator [Herbaspirillum lusitanum]|uniref:LysR substrate-binding domain-containing protein n=1 Tax=Herbaspirillum lusitanum TaxID=213312 RepID=UPI002238E583|nr:LysR substrate-binding domain-containing protein [Herbaspirillum lusitanum]MCW5296785.1 LysR family transcriptional regulator [Herbaspirillum lusitanum]